MANKPRIRFRGFTEDWEQRKLGDVADVRDGTHDSPKFYNDGFPLVTSKNLKDGSIDFSDCSFISKQDFDEINKRSKVDSGDILFGMIGTIGNPAIVEHTGFAIKNVALIKEGIIVNNRFIYHLLSSKVFDNYIARENAGGTQKFIALNQIRNFIFLAPTLEEQNKIIELLDYISQTITLHQCKLKKLNLAKKSLLQKLFPRNGSQIPGVRFKGFTDAWEQRKLSQITVRVTRKNGNQSDLPLTISAQDGLVDQRKYFNRQVASRDMTNYYLIKKGEFAYNKSYSEGYPFGAVKRLDYYDIGALSTLYILFEITDKNISSDFLVSYYMTHLWYKEVSKRAAEGARNHGLLNISTEDFFNSELNIPNSIEEQVKIGNLIKQFDKFITLHQRKLERLQEVKKGLLQKMFV